MEISSTERRAKKRHLCARGSASKTSLSVRVYIIIFTEYKLHCSILTYAITRVIRPVLSRPVISFVKTMVVVLASLIRVV